MLRKKVTKSKSIYKRTRKMQTNAILSISVKDKLGKIYKCSIPIIKIKRPHFRMRKNSIESTVVVPISADNQNWEIVNLKGRRIRPSRLKNKMVVLNRGTKKIRGIVVEAAMMDGGATSPSVGGGLPPIDE